MRKGIAAVGLVALREAPPSWGEWAEQVHQPDGSVLPVVELDRHIATYSPPRRPAAD